MQVESWRIISWPGEGDHMLSLWCGALPVLDYAGGLVMSRHRNGRAMPPETLQEFKRAAARFGIKWDDMMKKYLKAHFTLGKHDVPHKMIF